MRVTSSRYERKYEHALRLVGDRFKVGEPYWDKKGNRVCLIGDGLLCCDYDIFMFAWSKAVAERLTLKRDG